ncbi:hypothetical protein GV790_17875 [Nocardia cyriacigeorgica]|uniref:hypothetical protein n=1 Tax=Nocardia cyriacigeorgica TaxID=135487 RepID=UPI0013CF7EF0|nr:hypothetical protein [Nocardia cyriacigeorgica]
MPDLFYYPKINAPQAVIYQALLYWDRLVTLTPPGPLEDFLSPRMHQVHDAGLYLRLPANHWPRFTGGVAPALWALSRLMNRIPAADLVPDAGPDTYLHSGKFAPELISELCRRGLARPADGLGFSVSAATQLCLVSVAARDIAAAYRDADYRDVSDGYHHIDRMYPYTDSLAAHRFAHSPITFHHPTPEAENYGPRELLRQGPRGRHHRTGPCLDVEIGRLLPVPAGDISTGDLIDFRERYSDERRRLMIAIDRLVSGLHGDYEDPRDVLHAVRREVEQALADLEQAGRSAGFSWARRTVTVSIALGAAYAGQKLFPGEAWILGVIGGMAINVATSSTRPSPSGLAGDISYLQRVGSAVAEQGAHGPSPR